MERLFKTDLSTISLQLQGPVDVAAKEAVIRQRMKENYGASYKTQDLTKLQPGSKVYVGDMDKIEIVVTKVSPRFSVQ